MLFHVSIDARDPRHVASVLAELFGGEAFPFPPVGKGSWVAMAGDERNTTVEVYPRDTVLEQADGDADATAFVKPVAGRIGTPTHFAMATPLTEEQVFAIAEREGWVAKYRKRGGLFGVIELWIEGDQMVEVLTAPMQAEYLTTLQIGNWREMLAAHAPA